MVLDCSAYLLHIALDAGGEPGVRLANEGGLLTSPDTSLCL